MAHRRGSSVVLILLDWHVKSFEECSYKGPRLKPLEIILHIPGLRAVWVLGFGSRDQPYKV